MNLARRRSLGIVFDLECEVSDFSKLRSRRARLVCVHLALEHHAEIDGQAFHIAHFSNGFQGPDAENGIILRPD